MIAAAGCGRSGFDVLDVARDTAPDTSDPLAITAREIAPPTFTTSSTSFVDVAGGTLVIPPSPGRQWLLLVNGFLSSTSLNYAGPEARYLVDGIERGLGGTESVDVGKPGPWQHMFVLTGTSDPITVQLQARDTLAAQTTLERARVIAMPIPDSADPLYASADAIQLVTSMTLTEVASLVLTPASAGEYLVFLLFNDTEEPSGSNVDGQWLDASGIAWGSSLQNARGAWQSVLFARRAVLGPGPTTLRFQAAAAAMSQVQYIRAFAFRLSGATNALTTLTAGPETSGTTPVTAATLSVSVAPAPHYLVFGTTRIDDQCDVGIGVRGIQFVVDDVIDSFEHLPGNCSTEHTYGHLDLVESPPATMSSGLFSGTGSRMQHVESTLLVLGVE
jgi:hypothetical protein